MHSSRRLQFEQATFMPARLSGEGGQSLAASVRVVTDRSFWWF
jgi:hypothetical protein